MKMKMNLGEGGIKGFLARHVEKIVFGLAVLLVLWVALPDGKRRPVDEDKLGPESIVTTVNNAKSRLAQDTWELIKGERFRTPDDYPARAKKTLIRVERAGYTAEIPLDKPPFPPDQRRKDPTIYPPEKLEVVVNYGAITLADKTSARIERRPPSADDEDVRPLPPQVLARFTKHGAPIGGAGTKTQSAYIVALLAKIPTKRQADEYIATFKDAADYVETRDFPNYGVGAEDPKYGKYYFRVERAEIAPDGTEGQWKIIGDLKRARKMEETWPQVPELAENTYVDPVWSMALPPLMLRDLRPLAMHSEVPSAAQAAEEASSPDEEPEDDPMEDVDGPIVGGDEEVEGAAPPRGAPRPPVTRPRNPRAAGEGNFGMNGGAMGNEDVEFKLFRYFDLDVQPGKSYVYRVKLYIEDPNDPSPTQQKPPLRVLDKTVIDRLTRKTDKNVWWRESDYSEVSPVVSVPATNQVLAGSVLPAGTSYKENPDDRTMIRAQEPLVNVMALTWDEKKAMDVSGTLRAARGSVVNFTTDTEAIDVSASVLRKLPAYEFQTGSVVLDLRGGEPLGKKSDLSTPGEMLLIDADGNLVVRKELDDRAAFAENTFPEAPEATTVDTLTGEEEEDKRPRTRPKPPRGSEGIDLMDDRASPRPPRQPRTPRP